MAKDKTTANDAGGQTPPAPPSTEHVTLTASSREELNAKFDELKASHKEATLWAGAVGQSHDKGTYELHITIINT